MSSFTASNNGAFTTNYTDDSTFYYLGGGQFTGPPINWTLIVNGYTPVIPNTFTSDWIVEGTGGSGKILSVTFENVNGNAVIVILQNGGGTFSSGAGNRFSPPQMTCFLENSKIRTDRGYIYIQNLQKGDLVLTLKNGCKPVFLLGKKEIYHMASKERIKDQLYKLSSTEYPEIFEDLIITGAHCLLVDNFSSQKQKDDMLKVHGKTFVTDGKYRLPACADEKTTVYETAGTYTIYHLALENDDAGMNYGIYANGLLVETCSKRYLKDKSDMTLY